MINSGRTKIQELEIKYNFWIYLMEGWIFIVLPFSLSNSILHMAWFFENLNSKFAERFSFFHHHFVSFSLGPFLSSSMHLFHFLFIHLDCPFLLIFVLGCLPPGVSPCRLSTYSISHFRVYFLSLFLTWILLLGFVPFWAGDA